MFPRENETYNYTTSFPIVFAFQNLSAAAKLGSFRFMWIIMPYNSLSKPIPGGVLEDMWQVDLAANNMSTFTIDHGSPYVLVNNTNLGNWQHGPNYGGTAYALQCYVQWDNTEVQFTSPAPKSFDHILFAVLPGTLFHDEWGAPDPGVLGNVTDNCAQLGSVGEIGGGNGFYESFRTLEGIDGHPCRIGGDETLVSSILNVVGSLAMTQSLVTITTSTIVTSTNAAVRTGVPVRSVYAAAAMFGGLKLLAFR